MTKSNIFTEIGYGNDTFINTEIEYEDGTEIRTPGFKKMKVNGAYFRLWFGYTVIAISTVNGFNIRKKDKKKMKILFGIEGCCKTV